MMRNDPAVIGAVIASLDDTWDDHAFSLGYILQRAAGVTFFWPDGSKIDRAKPSAIYNKFWRDWWANNKDRLLGAARPGESTGAAPK